MNKQPSLYRAPLALTTICLVAVSTLAIVNLATKDKIAYVKEQYQLAALGALLARSTQMLNYYAPTAQVPKALKIIAWGAIAKNEAITDSEFVQQLYHIAKVQLTTTNDEIYPLEKAIPELYILKLMGQGFGGPLELLVAYRIDGSLYHALLLDHNETPGFGKKAEDPSYMQMFWDKKLEAIPARKQQLQHSYFDAVSGSTISFQAIASVLQSGAAWLINKYKLRKHKI